MDVSFKINGILYKVAPENIPIGTSLNTFIRQHAKLTGTKSMCWEGGCGVCVVSVKKGGRTWAVNSCLQNIYSCHGMEITTVEGLGSKKFGMHKIQSRLANFNGTQCGYCSPGMVMNMHSLMEANDGKVTMEEVENSFGGNICRCTGYRPILDAFKSLAVDASKSLLENCQDIEDLDKVKKCKKTGMTCLGSCTKDSDKKKIDLNFAEDKEWHKVYSLKEIFEIFGRIGDKPYMLVAGNTAHGVYRRPYDLRVFIDVSSVDELRDHNIGESLKIGGNVTLTEFLEIMEHFSESHEDFWYLKEFIKHVDLVANVPVRNMATLAGNLMIKHDHKEFPSDIFLLLAGVGAKIIISDSESSSIGVKLEQFLNIDMKKKIIKSIVLPKLSSKRFMLKSYKIMPRAQNAHAYVNASFLIEGKNTVASAKICYGGINPNFIRAHLTEKYLVGKNLYSNETLQKALNLLQSEINPDLNLPTASPVYRKKLALSLFYKFILNTAPPGILNSIYKSGGENLTREISSGIQTFDTYEKNWPLTKNIPKIEADVQCTGEAKYVNDLPILPNELFGAFVLADKIHCKILAIDASKALEIPGVVAFYSAKDIPGKNTFMPKDYLFVSEPEEIFCSSEVKFHGQVCGIILAERPELAIMATKQVKIKYGEAGDKKILPTIKDVFENNAKDRIHKMDVFCKEAEEVGVDGIYKISGRFEMAGQYHFTMEPQSTVVIPIEDGLEIYAATQWIDLTQIVIAEALNIPNNTVNMNVRRLGGGFGGKISRCNQIACAAAVAAFKLNRPVRFIMSMEANMSAIGKRYGCISDYKVDVDANGKITKLSNEYAEDYGSASNEPSYLTTNFFSNCYQSKTWSVTANMTLTDAPSNTWCRGPGTLEGIAMVENIMEHIAFTLNKDPLEVRLANIDKNIEMYKILPDFAESVEYYQRKQVIDMFNQSNRWIKQGISIVPMKFHIEYFGSMNALVSVYHRDGTVAICHGGIEMGQGLNTKAAQTAAYTLGIPIDKISIKSTNNHTAPNAIVTGGSIGSEISCFAIKNACEELLKRLEPLKEKDTSLTWEALVQQAFAESIDLSASYFYKASDLEEYCVWGAACCEVEVDILSGNFLLKRVDILEDLGESISPGIDVGQIEGAFVMGLGYWLTEELIYDPNNGKLLTNRSWNYKVPGPKDIPVDFRIKFSQKSSNPFGVLRSKAVGEPAICLSIVSTFALRHALNSARSDCNIKEFLNLGAPTTVEKIFLSANNDSKEFLLK